MTRRKKLLFAVAAMALGTMLASTALLAADLYAHHRAQNSAGLNRWGYRGPVAGRKAPGELRIVMLGGSTVFGYGVPWQEAAPAFLERQLQTSHPDRKFTVVNLGYNNEGAFAARPTLEDYAYLDYDVVILYEGYNDRSGDDGPNTQVYRRQSVVFRLTGYSPMLPLVVEEKVRLLRHGTLAANPIGGQQVFRPSVTARTSAAAMESAMAVTNLIGGHLDRLSSSSQAARQVPFGTDCEHPWRSFCETVVQATQYARARGKRVLVAVPPIYPSPKFEAVDGSQHRSLAAAIQKRFGADDGVAFLDLSYAIDISKPDYSFDAMHLTALGHEQLAGLMKPAVERLAGLTGK
jgi:hypothetical protein